MQIFSRYLRLAARISALVLAIAGLTLLYQSSANTYQVLVDGVELEVQSHATLVETILHRAGIDVNPEDVVYPDIDQAMSDGGMIEVRKAHPIRVISGEETYQLASVGRSVGEILADLNQPLLPGDRVWVDGFPALGVGELFAAPPQLIHLEKARSITLNMEGEEFEFRSSAPTLGEALAEMGILMRVGDELSPGPETPIDQVHQASLNRATPLAIGVDGGVIQTQLVADTVGEALAKAGVALIGLDYSVPDINASLPEEGQIQVVRVVEDVLIEQTPIPFQTGYQPDPELELDQQSIIEQGAYGVQARRIRVRYEDGKEISRSIEGEWVAREPVQRIIGYGTNIVVRRMDTPHGPIEYWRALRMYATSYSPSRAGVPDDWPWFGKTACGKDLVKGLVAIDNRYIPFHTMMYVPGYGFAEACDIGGGVKGRWIDLGYEDHNWENWHEYVTVYFLTPVPPANSIAWIFP